MGFLFNLNRRIYALFYLMNYIVTKSLKSKGLAMLLVAFLGPIGMFYSTILGGIVMTLGTPILLYGLLAKAAFSHSEIFVVIAIIWAFIAYILCFLWSVSAVENYNNRIMQEANPDIVYSESNNPYKTWIIVFLAIGLLSSWWVYYRNSKYNNQKSEIVEQNNVESPKEIKPKKLLSEEKNLNEKGNNFDLRNQLYSGQWVNTDLDINGYAYELYLKEKNLKVEGTLDKFKLRGYVKEAYEEEDLLRRELIADLFDENANKIALVSIDLAGNYEKAWNEKLTITVKEKYSEEPLLDIFNGVSFLRN